MEGRTLTMGAFKQRAFSFVRSLNEAMWINSYPDETEQQANKKCCEFCNTEVPGNMTRLFGCSHCDARYCSREHKKADFRFHKMRCMNYNQNVPFPSTTDSYDSFTQTNTLQQLQTDNDNYIATPFQTYQQNPSTRTEFPGTNQLSPVQLNQNSTSPQRVTLPSPQMQYSQPISTQRTSPGSSREGFSYMQNLSPYQSNSNFYSNTSEKPSPMQAIQEQLTPSSLPNYLNASTTSSQMGSVQMTSYSNANDQITLEDALSFLDEEEAKQYSSPQQTQQLSPLANGNPTTSPTTFVPAGESQAKQSGEDFNSAKREEQAIYDQLLLLDPKSSMPGQLLSGQGGQEESQSLSPSTSNMNPNEQYSQNPSSSLSPKINDEPTEEISARMCEYFGLLNKSSEEVPPLKKEGIFTRYDLRDVAQYIIRSLYKNNYCIVDYLHGEALATSMLDEVQGFHRENAFSQGRLSSSKGKECADKQNVREDLVTWTDGKGRKTIKKHMSRMDLLLKFCNKFTTECEISSRTQAMVACYPGRATGYKQHIDNPSKDGRCITTLYYLNPDWNVKTDGGVLKLFPRRTDRKEVDVEPIFDRLLLFWSDKRTPHEVTPAYKIRYAITLWYFDEQERKEYINRYKEGKV